MENSKAIDFCIVVTTFYRSQFFQMDMYLFVIFPLFFPLLNQKYMLNFIKWPFGICLESVLSNPVVSSHLQLLSTCKWLVWIDIYCKFKINTDFKDLVQKKCKRHLPLSQQDSTYFSCSEFFNDESTAFSFCLLSSKNQCIMTFYSH